MQLNVISKFNDFILNNTQNKSIAPMRVTFMANLFTVMRSMCAVIRTAPKLKEKCNEQTD